jgi:hypothetical protein
MRTPQSNMAASNPEIVKTTDVNKFKSRFGGRRLDVVILSHTKAFSDPHFGAKVFSAILNISRDVGLDTAIVLFSNFSTPENHEF